MEYPNDQPWTPPSIESILEGKISWKRREKKDYEIIGYFLTCHLAIEYYIDQILSIKYPDLKWDDARINFSSKISLLGEDFFSPEFNLFPLIKCINSLRNKISHDIDYDISLSDLRPISEFISSKAKDKNTIPKSVKNILNVFTTMCSGYLAGTIYYHADRRRITR